MTETCYTIYNELALSTKKKIQALSTWIVLHSSDGCKKVLRNAVCESTRLLTELSLVRVQLGEPKEYSLSTVGVDDAGGPPVPIPNTEVKPCSAEDSALATGCENRKMPTFDSEYFLCKTALRFYEPYSCVLQCVYGMGEYGLRTCCTASLFFVVEK